MDTINERHVQEARSHNNARSDRTIILVAHRLSTLRDANRIFVFDDGHIVESGTFVDLLQCGGVFADLARFGEPADNDLPPWLHRRF